MCDVKAVLNRCNDVNGTTVNVLKDECYESKELVYFFGCW